MSAALDLLCFEALPRRPAVVLLMGFTLLTEHVSRVVHQCSGIRLLVRSYSCEQQEVKASLSTLIFDRVTPLSDIVFQKAIHVQ